MLPGRTVMTPLHLYGDNDRFAGFVVPSTEKTQSRCN